MSAAAAPPSPRPATQRFRTFSRRPALSPDQKRRQATVTDAAWRAFRAGSPMAAFLNADRPDLGGRPLDLAINSDAGLAAVLAALAALAPPTVPQAPGV